MHRFLLILALSASLLSSLATARPLAELSRTTTTEISTPAAPSSSSPLPPAPEHTDSGSTTPEANPPTHAAAAASVHASEDEPAGAEAPEAASQGRHKKHRSEDKSIAGGEVILGGLVTAIFAAVFCYIRVTRKKSHEDEPIEPIKS